MRMARRGGADPTPICRCRVLYLGSSVPQVTKDGLQGIQEPLRELYPAEGAVSARGIDSWLSVWSNGLLLENVDENQKKVTRFFPIESLHYCAAVRYVVVSGGEGAAVPRFLPLDSPFARNPNINHPPLFACIMRRTMGIKVLECHAFICKRETPANALVRCCFHAYADSMYARSLEGGASQYGSVYGGRVTEERVIEIEDISSANSEILPASLGSSPTQDAPASPTSQGSQGDEISIYNGDENHKVWAGQSKAESDLIYSEYSGDTLRSARSTSTLYGTAGGRIPRPRQMIMPSVAPPPPETEKDKKGKKDNKGKGRRERDDDEGSRLTNGGPPRPVPLTNGTGRHHHTGSLPRHLNGHGGPPKSKGKFRILQGTSSLAERKTKPMRGPPPFVMVQGPPGPPPHHGPPPPHLPPGPHGPPMVPPHMGPPMGPPMGHMPPPHMVPMPGPHPPPPPHMVPMPGPPPHMMPPLGPPGPYGPPPGPPGRRPPSRVAEEPIYMPSARPLSPTASYQPGHFPHEQYLMQQYATTARPHQQTKKKKSRSKKDNDEDIYGRKGHLNERAFSYSIREEHRSRSYGSLAGLGEESMSKKDREILQMVADLDLSGDDLERVEPRPGVYRPPHPDRLSASGTIVSRISRASRR
ncbi:hypothetical protein Pmani_012354 [Petrolisthes manimaculis]|uniref:PID domain-containing protein n=1 Tax=Petrolisthes manimaculis TaxID=1843537 RepID=A0AAE1Q0Y9_9EUCA|nr:hypothetical protein Pmani_012354 [Petrolisthes manimaculis]